MSEPVSTEDGSSTHQSQEDAEVPGVPVTNEDVPLHFVDEEHEEEDSSPVSQTESGEFDQEQSSSRTRRRSSGEYDEGLFIFPQNNGYFKILADNKTSDNRQKIMEDIFSHKVTVIGLFGKEKSSDSNKAIEIFDNLAQRDLFSSMERSNDKIMIQGYHDIANHRIYLNLKANKQKDVKFMQLLLFLFHVCHIIICYHPSSSLDQSYLRLFQTLDIARTKPGSLLSKKLKSLKDIPRWWTSHGRPCNPRLIFYFSKCPLDLRGHKGVTEIIKKSGKLAKHPPIRRLEFSIEDQIHRVFKRAKITHNASNLFNLPAKDNYVFVNHRRQDNVGETDHAAFEHFFTSLENGYDDSNLSSHEFMPNFYHQTVTVAHEENGRSFGAFLANHLDTMIQRGPDNVDGSKYLHELPTAEQWYKGMTTVLDLFTDELSEMGKVQQTLTNHVDVDLRFSEARCAKALPTAFAAYKEGLQSHYLAEIHSSKMLQAMSLYSNQARGSASQKFAELLIEECTNYWMAGRQACEELSLTGNHCLNRKHQTTHDPMDKLPTMPHKSSLIFISACNCGKKQSNRDDPFSLIDANFTFYSEMDDECCRDLERTSVPQATAEALEDVKLQTLANLVTPTEVVKKQSTLMHMLTLDCDKEALPTFPSWALTHLGTSTIYSHSSGVNQPGFLNGTRVLHAWDVPLKKVNFKALQTKYPTLAENAMKRASFNPQRKGIEMGITAKLFIGMEYECPRGHRFISGSLDKAIRTSKDGSSGSKFVNQDVPLYLSCPCRGPGSRPLVSQLMRIHVVTPKAPVKVLFNPVVVPCPDGPQFYPGWKNLPEMGVHQYWIMRLPFIYCGKDGSHLPPKEVPDLNYAKLLKGCITVVEEDLE